MKVVTKTLPESGGVHYLVELDPDEFEALMSLSLMCENLDETYFDLLVGEPRKYSRYPLVKWIRAVNAFTSQKDVLQSMRDTLTTAIDTLDTIETEQPA